MARIAPHLLVAAFCLVAWPPLLLLQAAIAIWWLSTSRTERERAKSASDLKDTREAQVAETQQREATALEREAIARNAEYERQRAERARQRALEDASSKPAEPAQAHATSSPEQRRRWQRMARTEKATE
jgi:hypothetical protein